MANAASQARAVIAGSGKSLWPNYANNFKVDTENGQESLFEVQFKSGLNQYTLDGPGSAINEFWGARFFGSPYVVPSGGYGFNIPEKEFVDGYETGDLRKAATVFVPGDQYPDGQIQPASLEGDPNGYNVRKFYTDKSLSNIWDSPLNIAVMRLAEAYLILAEAVGPTTEGLAAINRVRRRAFGQPLDVAGSHDIQTGISATAFKTAVWRERKYELAFEMDRWFDMKRTGELLTSPQLIA